MPSHGGHLEFGVQDEIISSNRDQKLNNPPKFLNKVLLNCSIVQLSEIKELGAFGGGHLGLPFRQTCYHFRAYILL